MKGKIYLIPTTLGSDNIEMVIPSGVVGVIGQLSHFIVENVRTARRFIKRVCPDQSIDDLTFYTLNKHTAMEEIPGFLTPLHQGRDMGVMSEAGVPGIADPGERVVWYAQEQEIQVIPLTGPSSITLALMGSGLNGEHFAFHGYLPIHQSGRIKKLKALEKQSKYEGQTQIFMETPYRNNKLLNDLLSHCKEETYLCIARDITTENSMIRTRTIGAWKGHAPDLHKRPTIFILAAPQKH